VEKDTLTRLNTVFALNSDSETSEEASQKWR